MSISATFSTPLYEGTASAPTIGSRYDVAIAGRGYILDRAFQNGALSTKTVPLLRAQTDQEKEVGEQSINPEDFWRRSVSTWNGGAGQTFLDRVGESSRTRFRTSTGINPWTEGQISLLPVTARKFSTASTNLFMAVAGTHLYYLDTNALKYTTNLTAATTVTGTGGDSSTAPTSIASDGYTVWFCDGTRVHYTTRGNSTFAKYHTSDHVATMIRVAKDRLFTAKDQTIYTHSGTAGSGVAASFFVHPNADWEWTDVAEGPNFVYFSGFSGDKSAIYQATIKDDGTGLNVPTVAAQLPDGEIARSIQGYLDFLVIGTDRGIRFAVMGSSGLTIGDLNPIGVAVGCFEPQDRFVWFGWTNYDSSNTGLGRLDLRTLNGTAPAYASDLMAAAQGTVLSVVTFLGLRVFSVSGNGIWAETADKVTSGTITSGWIGYDLPYEKTAYKFDVRHLSGAGSYSVALASDFGTSYGALGGTITTTSAAADGATLPAGSARAELFEIQLTLNRSGTDTTASPRVTRWTLRADPAADRRSQLSVPILLRCNQTLNNKSREVNNPSFEVEALEALARTRQAVVYQTQDETRVVVVDNVDWYPDNFDERYRRWNGTALLSLKTI